MTYHTKIILDESGLPRQWYNAIADLPTPPPPPLHPGTSQPVGPDELAPLFPMDFIAQEVTGDRYVDIPEGVLDICRLWRPTPLYRAWRLERTLGTPARICYKYEAYHPPDRASQHRGAPGLLQRTARHQAAHHRDGRPGFPDGGVGRDGRFDMAAYQVFLSGEMDGYELPQGRIDAALTRLPDLDM